MSSMENELEQAPQQSEGIRAFDDQGREVLVPRADWSAKVLPGMIEQAWDDPDQLYMVVLNSLNDGFTADVAAAAEHLYEIDTVPARGVCMLSILKLQQGQLDEAEALLNGYLEKHGKEGSVLTNLAKVYQSRGEQERSEATLWEALETQPNLDNGLAWYASMAQDRGGEQAATEALERLRALPESWRAQLWLARGALNTGDLGKARELYAEALERAPKPVPGDLLMQMSGDLGSQGKLMELIEFTGPHFVPELHGMPVGNNLIKALMDTGNVPAAAQVRSSLVQFNRPDWRQALDYWDQQIAARGGVLGAAAQAQGQNVGQEIQLGMLRVDGPIWLPTQSPARPLFGSKATDGPSVVFLGGTAEAPENNSGSPEVLDQLGRLTRSLPLLLSEQVEMLAGASGRAMMPWAVASPTRPGGFVVSGQRWPDEMAVQSATADAIPNDYVVSVHLDAEVEPWTADLTFIRTSDSTRIGELSEEFDPANPEAGLRRLAEETVALLGAAGRVGAQVKYEVPAGKSFTSYLERLEQLLALRCSSMEGVPQQFLNGEREILGAALELSKAAPENANVRVLTVEIFSGMAGKRPEIVEEVGPQLQALEEAAPIPAVRAAFGG